MLNSIWYSNLIKPALTPPNWVFAPIWTILYILIFISLAVYINSYSKAKFFCYLFFTIQMLLNIIWMPVFFGQKSLLGGLITIILLDIFLCLTIYKFFKVSKIAGIILIPYFLWTIFATYLNLGYIILN